MFLAGNIPTKYQVQFGECWSCLGIFSNSTKLEAIQARHHTQHATTYMSHPS